MRLRWRVCTKSRSWSRTRFRRCRAMFRYSPTDAHANGNGHVSSSERAKLIGLAAYARKAHFQYNQDTGVYIMESLVEIPNFLKTVLPAWRRLFNLELDEKSANLLKGTRTIEI